MKNRPLPAVAAGWQQNAPASAPFRALLLTTALPWLAATGCGSGAAEEGDGSESEPSAGAAPTTGMPGQPDEAELQRQMELMGELQAIDQALMPLRERALEDADIRARERDLVAEVDAAMEALSPGVLEARARFDSLREEYGVAQQAGEQERVQTLGAELQGLQARLQQTQSAAFAQEGIAESLESFRERLFEWMRNTDPAADSLLNRAEEISDELQGMAGPPGN